MLKVDLALNHIPAGREHVVSLLESVNQPLVNIPSFGTAPTAGFMLGTRNDRGFFTVFVYLRQRETHATIIYVSEPRNLSAEQYRVEEGEALRFLESMGFVMDDLQFKELDKVQQEDQIRRVPIFRPPRTSMPTLDLLEVAEDAGDAVEAEAPRRTGNPVNLSSAPAATGAEGSGRPGRPVEPMFGGVSEALRRAGATGRSIPAGRHSMGVTPARSPLTAAGSGGPAAAGSGGPAPANPAPQASSAGSARPAQRGPEPAASRRPAAAQPQAQAPTPAPARAPAPADGALPADAEGLARLGRLLATFGVLVALALPTPSCKTPAAAPDAPLSAAVQTQVDIAAQQIGDGQFADAIKTLTPLLAEAPDSKDVHYDLGLSYMSLGKPAEAETHFRQALAIDPGWSMAGNTLGALLIGSHRCEEAEKVLKKVLEDILYATPEFAELHLARAEACLGKQQESLRRLQGLVVRRPQFCRGYLTIADISEQAKQPEVTIKACETFRSQCEQHEEIKKFVSPENSCLCYLRKGLAYAALGDVESARQSFTSCQSDGNYGQQCRSSLELLNQSSRATDR